MGFVLEVETNYLCLSSSTKMPRMKYVHRRRLKRILFGWCLFMAICVIFWLLNILNAPVARLENKLYVYWMSSDEELKADMEWDLSNLPNVVLTRVKTFDHDAALQTAYDDGHPVVLVVRDGVELSKTLLKEWENSLSPPPPIGPYYNYGRTTWTFVDTARHSKTLGYAGSPNTRLKPHTLSTDKVCGSPSKKKDVCSNAPKRIHVRAHMPKRYNSLNCQMPFQNGRGETRPR